MAMTQYKGFIIVTDNADPAGQEDDYIWEIYLEDDCICECGFGVSFHDEDKALEAGKKEIDSKEFQQCFGCLNKA